MKRRRILVIAPHPDDEILAAGTLLDGALRGGASVKVIFLTNGEANTLGHMRLKRRLFISEEDELLYGRERREEAAKVMGLTGITDYEFWEYCDTGLFEQLAAGNDLADRLQKTLRSYAPDTLIFPSARDLHRDHSAAALITESALARAGISPELLRYVNHGASRLARSDSEACAGPDISGRKLRLLQEYRTQFLLNSGSWNRLCGQEERFVSARSGYAPEFSLEFSGHVLLWVRSAFSPVRLNPAALYITAGDANGCRYCYFGRLSPGGELVLREFSGKKEHSRVEVQPLYGAEGCYLKFPRSLFSGCDRVFIKARKKLSFFDDSGFSMIRLPGPERGTPRTAVVVPCYNIAEQAEQAVRRALPLADTVIAVDDGSTDSTGERLEALKSASAGRGLHVLRLPRNSGKGAALAAGFAAAIGADPCFDLILTMDGDLQHHPEDIPRFKRAWQDGAHFISGCRAFSLDAPLRSRIGNNLINWLAALLFPNAISDTQSGFRGFSRELLMKSLRAGAAGGGRYEAELHTLVSVMKSDARMLELDIPAVYLDRNRTSHFRPLADSAAIVLAMLEQRFFRRNAP